MADVEPTAAPTLDARSSTCGMCLDNINDPRLLGCLHSFCRVCVARLALTSSTEDGSASVGGRAIRCPSCRSVCSIPEEGVEGLVKDVTRPTNEEEAKCQACAEEGGDGNPTAWCEKCQAAYCNDHAMPHMLTNAGHSISALSEREESGRDGTISPQSTPWLCPDHNQPLAFHCASCNVAVCGHCAVIGRHVDHKPVLLIEDMVAERKEKVLVKVETLERDSLPPVEEALISVDRVRTELGAYADRVRDDIQVAGQRLIEAVGVWVANKLQEVDDIEQTRFKALDRQHDELKDFADSMKSVASFTDCLKVRRIPSKNMAVLLPMVEEQLDLLSRTSPSLKPVEHSALGLHQGHVNRGRYVAAVEWIIGKVSQCRASAAKSALVKLPGAEESTTVSIGGTAAITVQARNEEGDSMLAGGDIIKAEWLSGPERPQLKVIDHFNGRYTLLFKLQEEGEYALAVRINGMRMPETFSKKCEGAPAVTFDPEACQDCITVQEDGRSATLSAPSMFGVFLGKARCALRRGKHQWKVKVNSQSTGLSCREIGVAAQGKPILSEKNPFNFFYSWCGDSGDQWALKRQVSTTGDRWKENDIIHVSLDCEARTLVMTNLCSDNSVTFEDLPEEELFPVFLLKGAGTSMTLVE